MASSVGGGGEPTLELAQLVVDEHAQRLERARGGMLAGLARANGARHELRKLGGAGERRRAARVSDDGFGDAPREAFFSERGDHLANLVDARASEPRRYGLAACRIHTHVERAVRPEAETASRVVELGR